MLDVNKCDVELSKNVLTKDGFSDEDAIKLLCNFFEGFGGRVLKIGYKGIFYKDFDGFYRLCIRGVGYIKHSRSFDNRVFDYLE